MGEISLEWLVIIIQTLVQADGSASGMGISHVWTDCFLEHSEAISSYYKASREVALPLGI